MANGFRLAVLAALAFGLLAAAGPAQAQFAVFISGDGNDANNCLAPATACRSLAKAQISVQPGGVIHVLPGDYFTVVITKSLQIIADAGQASISGSTSGINNVSAGILVNAGPDDEVTIRGITVDRHGSTSGNGIALIAGGALHIEHCRLVNAAGGSGIVFQPAGDSSLSVSDTTIANNGKAGILIRPDAGASVKANAIDTLLLNNRCGIDVFKGGKTTVRYLTIADNSVGVRSRKKAVVRIADSIVTGNGTGLDPFASGKLISYGGNIVADNIVDGNFTGTVKPK